MKMMGILILLLAVITVAITLILVSRLSKTAGKDQKEETFDRSVSGMLSNAYILKSEEKDIIVLYRGETYLAEGKPEKKYTGVADIELTKGKVTKIYAKPSTIKGVLTSYSSKSVQIEGYEPLSAEKRSAGVSCGKFRTCKNSCPSGKDFRSCCRKFQSGTGCCRAESLCTCKLSGGHGRKGPCAAQKRKRKYICQSFCLQRGCLYRGWK